MYYANLMYELHKVEEKLFLYKNKYKLSFIQFEKQVLESKNENYEWWDDYMEWKAYNKSYNELNSDKDNIKNGNYKLS